MHEYKKLRAQGSPRTIIYMCFLTVKSDLYLKTNREKIIIVVLGNHKDIYLENNENYAPVLSY